MSSETPQNKIDKYDKPLPFWVIALIPIYISVLFVIIFFPLAQDWAWIEAWLFIISFVINMTISFYPKLLDINKDQKLIDTGLYGHVRHPLYLGAVLMILGLPIALGSWISLIPATIGVLAIIIRIKFEEEMLIKGMDGYIEYRTRVKYKLIPKLY